MKMFPISFLLLSILSSQSYVTNGQFCPADRGPGGGKFNPHRSVEIIDNLKDKCLIRELKVDKIDCVFKCFKDWSCRIYFIDENQKCFHYNDTAMIYLKYKDTDSKIYIRKEMKPYQQYNTKSFTKGLVHFWPLDHLIDIIGGKNLSVEPNVKFTSDRHDNTYSAIQFNNGYGEFPVNQYLEPTGSTYMLWIKMLAYTTYQGILSFAKTLERLDANEIYIYLETGRLKLTRYENENQIYFISSNTLLPIGEWVHIAVTLDTNKVIAYINSVEVGSFLSASDSGETTYNYLGKNLGTKGTKANSVFDEVKIFNRILSVEEITDEMNKQQPYDIMNC